MIDPLEWYPALIIMEFVFQTLELYMPVYDYRCLECGNKFALKISYEEYGNKQVACPKCASTGVTRRIGRIRIGHSEEERLSHFADPAQMDALEDDPVALGGMLRKMKDQMGEEIAPEFDDVVDRLEKGQTPEQIERELPDLDDDDPGSTESEPFTDF
jgi:putative FmdB family regulatory protein